MSNVGYDQFIQSLYVKYPKKAKLTEALVELLSIEREAVYRRLRKDVLFSIYEIAKIAHAWNISIDNIFGIAIEKSYRFQMDYFSYNQPTKQDLETLEDYVQLIKNMAAAPDSTYVEISNVLPRSLFCAFPLLSKFHVFKWMYFYGTEKDICPFSQLTPPQKIMELAAEYAEWTTKLAHVSYIWDEMIIRYLLNDIRYFASIYLITAEEVQLLKEELSNFLNYVENLAVHGCFPGTNNKLDLYISRVNLDTNYCYFSSPSIKVGALRAFILSLAISTEEEICDKFQNWITMQKRVAMLISQVDEKQRIEFFRGQRALIAGLQE
ncbi:MAG: hypothetical protein LBN18_07400 [Dysgonamonadaceae bacterium]|jgi:hypothetical protein|nr:hypothetical protein [Dysgonamonadaceae bacterium]